MPTYQSASLSIEREFPASTMVTVGFSYSGGKNLLVGNGAANPNAIPLADLQYGDALNNLAFNQSLRPYPQYQGFNVYGEYPVGRYQRDAGYVRVEKRSSSGLSVNAYFEFNKQMDDYSGPYGTQDFFNRQDEWSVTAGNRPERLELTYTYELPFGANKPFLRFPDWRRYVIDGWSVSGTGTVASGDPMYLTPLFNNTGGVVQALHVDVVPGVDQHVVQSRAGAVVQPGGVCAASGLHHRRCVAHPFRPAQSRLAELRYVAEQALRAGRGAHAGVQRHGFRFHESCQLERSR